MRSSYVLLLFFSLWLFGHLLFISISIHFFLFFAWVFFWSLSLFALSSFMQKLHALLLCCRSKKNSLPGQLDEDEYILFFSSKSKYSASRRAQQPYDRANDGPTRRPVQRLAGGIFSYSNFVNTCRRRMKLTSIIRRRFFWTTDTNVWTRSFSLHAHTQKKNNAFYFYFYLICL